MDPPLNLANIKLQQDFEIQNELTQLFAKGQTIMEKTKGLELIIQGLKLMKLWISKQQDEYNVKRFTDIYKTRLQDVQQKMSQLEKQKGIPEIQNIQQQQKQPEEEQKQTEIIDEDINTEISNIKWNDISGLDVAKEALREAVILPIKFPQIFAGNRQPWRGIIIYGPSGTGKRLLVQACANEAECNYFEVSALEVIKKNERECHHIIKRLFRMAREKKPSIIFINGIDYISTCENRQVITEFLVQMQMVDNQLSIVATTNQPWNLSAPIRRRFEKFIYIPLPDVPARTQMIRNIMNIINEDELDDLVKRTEGYSGSDINSLVRNNDLVIDDFGYKDFVMILNKSKRTVSVDQIQQFEQWKTEIEQIF